VPAASKGEKSIGLQSDAGQTDLSESSKVESIMIGEEDSRVIRESERKKAAPPDGSGKLEILNDQFGLSEQAKLDDPADDDGVHDYDWFIEAIRNDAEGHAASPKPTGDSGKLSIEDPSMVVDPVTPPRDQVKPSEGPGVEKFIDEFKKEMEQIRDSDAGDLIEPPSDSTSSAKSQMMDWEDKVEQLTPDQIEPFTREFARQLGERVAEKIVAKIDSDKLLKMIKAELLKRLSDK
jgi:hypothetical protein